MAGSTKKRLISQREFSRRLGVSHTAVQHAIASGRIPTVRGRIDPVEAERAWKANTDQSKPLNRITGSPKQTRAAGEPSMPMEFRAAGETPGGNGTATGYARARAARELYQAQLAKLELDRQRGLMVRVDEVRIVGFNSTRRARNQLMALPERLASILAATVEPAEVQRILQEELERICHELADAEASNADRS